MNFIYKNLKNRKRGFSIVEMLVIIAIMTLLTTLVYTSINDSKKQSRDQKRVEEISFVQLALEQFYSKNRYYPDSLNTLIPQYLPSVSADVKYAPLNKVSDGKCATYHLWIQLESKISVLDSKKGFNSLSSVSCIVSSVNLINASSSPLIYDVTP